MLRHPSIVCCPSSSVHHFQRSSKLLGLLKPNFMWSLHGSGEWKFVRGIWVSWPRWPPRPYMVKTLQKSSSLETKGQWPWALVCSIWALGPSKFVQMMTLGWPWPMARSNFIPYAFIRENLLECHLMEETYSKLTRVTWGICLHKNSDPRGLSAPNAGLYTCIKTRKNMYKIRLQILFWNLQQMGKVTRLFCWHHDFVHKGLSASAPRLYTCEKTLKNVYKIRIQRDLFETCNKWSKW